MAAELITLPFRPTINLNGGVESGAKLYIYLTGTTTPVTVYSDAGLTTPLTNPVVANSFGVFPDVYYDDTLTVRTIIQQANGVTLSDTDPYFSDGASAEASADAAALSAAVAQAAAGPNYADTIGGLAATSDGQAFAVDNGDGTVTIYLNDGGVAVAQRTLATTVALAATTGGSFIGLPDSTTLDSKFSATGGFVAGSVEFNEGQANIRDYATIRATRTGAQTTRVYVLPQEATLFQTSVTDGVISSFTAFFDDYDAQLKESLTNPDVTGPHYRDGGVSAYLGPSFAPPYTATIGHIALNAKSGGNWWPFRPSSGLTVEQKSVATAFLLQPSVALPGPTFAGGGVYPSDMWRPGKDYSVGDIVHSFGRVYEVTVAGTSGTIPPLHDGVGGARADGWDVSILTTVGTLSGGFYRGTDGGTGGGTVEYALIEQMYPATLDRIFLIAPAMEVNPLIGLGSNAQLGQTMYVLPEGSIVGARRESDGSGTTNNAGLHIDANGAMRYGYSTTKGLLARHNSDTDVKFDGVSASFSELSKASGATTVNVAGVNIVKFNDAAATNFTGFTGATQGQIITLIFNNSNTTLVHSTDSLRIPGGANITPGSNDAFQVVMRSATVAQIIGAP